MSRNPISNNSVPRANSKFASNRFDRAFLDQVLNRTSITSVVGRKVTWDKKKSNPARGDMWACCPFHGEKTPSFHALEDRGIYHCFGCGETGNAIDFLMGIENMEFGHAVEELAHMAGLEIPKTAIIPKETVDKTDRIYKALDAARNIFAQELQKPDGKAARDYLLGRGLNINDWDTFALGYSPNGRTFIRDKLVGMGHKLEDLIEGGIVRKTEDGQTYDYFRNRVMFAIEDAQGRTISFGARTLDKDGQPKYLNGPESPVFSKGFNLYRFRNARALVREHSLIICEGYMDVIAIEKAGLPAVAPLGTALTQDQIAIAWRLHPMPVLCFDGDDAGQRAAGRALERALPLISSFKSFRFAILPEGQDPDDVLKSQGKNKFLEFIDNSKTLTQFLFEFELKNFGLDNAEARASLRKSLRARAGEIKDEDLKNEINLEVKNLVDDTLGRNRSQQNTRNQPPRNNPPRGGGRGVGRTDFYAATDELKQKVTSSGITTRRLTERAKRKRAVTDIVGAVILRPQLLEFGLEKLANIDFGDKALDSLKDAILDIYNQGGAIDFRAVNHHLQSINQKDAIKVLDGINKVPINGFVKKGSEFETIKNEWLEALLKEEAMGALANDMKLSELERLIETGDEEGYRKLSLMANERHKLSGDNS